MADFAIEQAQRQGLPVAVAQAFCAIVRVLLQQVTLLHPDPFQRTLLLQAGRPCVAEKLKLGQPRKQCAVVIGQPYVLMWLEQPLRVIDHTAPAGREDQRRRTQIVGVAHKPVEGREALFVTTEPIQPGIPLAQVAYQLRKALFTLHRAGAGGLMLTHHIGLGQVRNRPLRQHG